MDFKLQAPFKPTGDQPQAINELVDGLNKGEEDQILLGVTGSGKTFTVANVIQEVNRPTLILSHNKTLAAQLYGEFQQFFPENQVEYFISYYDYYQPEAYLPTTGLYIEKDLSINEEIEKLRLKATSALMNGRRDTILIASVSCIYGMGNPDDFGSNIVELKKGQTVSRNQLLHAFVEILYSRVGDDLKRGTFRVKGDTVDVYPGSLDIAYRITLWGDEVETLHTIDPHTGQRIEELEHLIVWPANLFVTGKDAMQNAMKQIQDDLMGHVGMLEKEGQLDVAKRIRERTEFDLEMMRELGYCTGIENYSRYFDGRTPGQRPFCLLDYFPDDFLLVVDESHVTLPQVRAMWGGDRSRKINLVDYGFRLPAALDNRPLTFNEFEEVTGQTLYVSATPGDYELQKSEGVIVEQIIRPTGLLDPKIEVRPSLHQIDDFLEQAQACINKDERVLVTTLTKRMAEELSKYLEDVGMKAKYIHSEVNVVDRVEILRELRLGVFDILVGVNLLREGLDLPEVSLVVIFDADKEGFLRNHRSMIQTIGRAARNSEGRVVMYADKITGSMERAIDETNRRRAVQEAYNKEHGITPTTVKKSKEAILGQTSVADSSKSSYVSAREEMDVAADPVVGYMDLEGLEKLKAETKRRMEKAAKELDFITAAQHRDELFALDEKIKKMAK